MAEQLFGTEYVASSSSDSSHASQSVIGEVQQLFDKLDQAVRNVAGNKEQWSQLVENIRVVIKTNVADFDKLYDYIGEVYQFFQQYYNKDSIYTHIKKNETDSLQFRDFTQQLQDIHWFDPKDSDVIDKDDHSNGIFLLQTEEEIRNQLKNIEWENFEVNKHTGELGKGAFGTVYTGYWGVEQVAVKELQVQETSTRSKLEREALVMQKLAHPNVLVFYGMTTKPGENLYLVMELADGGSLLSLLTNPYISLSWDRRRRFALDIALAMHFLHKQNPPIIHRDLKSSNVMVVRDTLKVGDFGFAVSLSESQNTPYKGTIYYRAPELFDGPASTATDVYSYGIVLWEIAARKTPYFQMRPRQIQDFVVKGNRPTVPIDAPASFQKLMTDCWNHDAEKRPTFFEIIPALRQMDFVQVLYKMPPPVWWFSEFGRKAELENAVSRIKPALKASTIVRFVITGMPGMGKSQLALKITDTLKSNLSVAWRVDASSKATLQRDVISLGLHQELEISNLDSFKPDVAVTTVLARLLKLDNPWLLLLDNVEILPAELDNLLLFEPITKATGILLATSQLTNWDNAQNVWMTQRLDQVDSARGVDIICRRLKQSLKSLSLTSKDQITEISKEFGGLPLALAQAAAYMAEAKKSPQELLEELKLSLHQVLDKQALAGIYSASVLTSFRLAFARLYDEDQILMKYLSLLAVDNIPLSLLDRLMPQQARSIIERLSTFSLVQYNSDIASVHAITQQATRILAPVHPTLIKRVLESLMEHSKKQNQSIAEIRRVEALLPHLQTCVRHAELEADNPDLKSITAITQHAIGDLFLDNLAQAPQALPWYKKALDLIQTQDGEFSLQASVLSSLGRALGNMGDKFKSLEIQEQVLQLKESHFDPDSVEIAQALTNVAGAAGACGQPFKKRDLLQRALDIYVRKYGENNLDVTIAMDRLAYAMTATNQANDALNMLQKTLAIQESLLEKDHVQLANTEDSIGDCLANLNRAQEALPHHIRAIEITEKHFSPTHKDRLFAIFLGNYGISLTQVGDFDKADEMLERSKQMFLALNFDPTHNSFKKVLEAIAILEEKKKSVSEQ